MRQRWPQRGRLIDLTAEGTEQAANPHDWQDVDIAIVPGQLAVAENAAVWVSHAGNDWRSIYFLTQKLVLVVPREAELFEQVEGSVDGRRGRGRVLLSYALDEFGAGCMPIGGGEHIDDQLALCGPALTPLAHCGLKACGQGCSN